MTATFVIVAGCDLPSGSGRPPMSRWPGLVPAFSAPDIIVLAAASRPLVHITREVMVIGSLQRSAGPNFFERMTPGSAGPQIAEALTASFWGDYVAIIRACDGTLVLCDPSGAGRAHLARLNDACIVSDGIGPEMLRQAGGVTGVDRAVLAGCLLHPAATVAAPLLGNVSPMTPGRLYSLPGGRALGYAWSPRRVITPVAQPANLLREAVDLAVLSSAGRRPLVQLSGGLDSSIVFGSLAAAGRSPAGFIYSSSVGDVSEVRYAREITERGDGTLYEAYPRDTLDYGYLADLPQTATPYLYGLDTGFEDAAADVLRRCDADGMLTGQGGDAVFLRSFSSAIAMDRRRDLGLRGLSLARLVDDAKRTRRTIWHHLLPALRDCLPGPTRQPELLAPQLIGRAYRNHHVICPHPWTDAVKDFPPGKRSHVALLANCQLFHAPRPGRAVSPRHPLLSQPVMDAVLAMPSWQLADGPIERALARRAFADRLPPSIANRTIKGEASSHFSRAALANLPFLRTFLLDGALASSGLLDVDALSQLLTEEQLFHSPDYRALVVQTSFEAWYRAWT